MFHCTARISTDLKRFANSWPSVSHFKSFSQSIEQFSTVGEQFGNKIPLCVFWQVLKNLEKNI